MNETGDVPAVALLFADAELGAHLREALATLGARIVHEGPAADVSPDTLAASGADVVVLNLELAGEAHLDHVYDALDGGSYQVVFNDAEASRNLSGWDKARWARHLAAKVVGSGDVDPPRPESAREVEVAADLASGSTTTGPEDEAETDQAAAAAPPDPVVSTDDLQSTLQSEQLEVELEALITDDTGGADAVDSPDESNPPADSPGDAAEAPVAPIAVEHARAWPHRHP